VAARPVLIDELNIAVNLSPSKLSYDSLFSVLKLPGAENAKDLSIVLIPLPRLVTKPSGENLLPFGPS